MVFRRYVTRTINGKPTRVPVFSQYLPAETKAVFAAPRRRKA